MTANSVCARRLSLITVGPPAKKSTGRSLVVGGDVEFSSSLTFVGGEREEFDVADVSVTPAAGTPAKKSIGRSLAADDEFSFSTTWEREEFDVAGVGLGELREKAGGGGVFVVVGGSVVVVVVPISTEEPLPPSSSPAETVSSSIDESFCEGENTI